MRFQQTLYGCAVDIEILLIDGLPSCGDCVPELVVINPS